MFRRNVLPSSSWFHSFIHSSIPLRQSIASSKANFHRVQSSASPFNFQYPSLSLTVSTSCLLLFLRLPMTFIIPSIFSWLTCFRRQYVCKIWPIQLAFLLFVLCRIFLSSLPPYFFIFHTVGLTGLLHHFPAPHFKIFQVLLINFPKCPSFSTIRSYTPNVSLFQFLP